MICPFCNKTSNEMLNMYNHHMCNNHGDIYVEFYYMDEKVEWVYLRNRANKKGYSLYIFNYKCSDSVMQLYMPDLMKKYLTINSVDKHITPENFEERLEKYLLFI